MISSDLQLKSLKARGRVPFDFAQDRSATTRDFMTDKILVLTTAGSKDEARRIGRALVERLLAACVNIVPQVGSIYRWEGEIEEAEEWLLIIKTTGTAFEAAWGISAGLDNQ